ncbi:RagB/SusD family nutrient uptake outer membrane protein [Sphingobacterium sp. HJSM2_6]|uniref:RagB/SusD family nutrient uptake outer membrane protein n=1 Tax=Sphingobacterium sp. HJSM2_6 TaxID=3366264 RepID=UPI003BC62804
MKMFIRLTLLVSTVFLITISCNKYLEVKPQDNILESQVFSSINGFNLAINGVYSELNDQTLYGANLTYGLLDVMAQLYNLTEREHIFAPYITYEYSNSEYKSIIEAIWNNAYKFIANLNTIVYHTDLQQAMLGEQYYGIFKGEALACRAMLHFDLLRLFGSSYENEKDALVLPYMTLNSRKVEPLLSNEEIIEKIIQDLLLAKDLLEPTDPVLKEGALNLDNPVSNLLNYRQYRLNYFAVKALLARAYLWKGDTQSAKKYASEVIEEGQKKGNEIFPFVTQDAVTNRPNFPDRIFSTEVLFALYNTSRINVQNMGFSNALAPIQILTFVGSLSDGRVPQLYPNENDFRRKLHWEQKVAGGGTEVLYFTKFLDVTDGNNVSLAYRYMYPLIRISEMYLIMAETSDNLNDAEKYINILQTNRGLPDVSLNSGSELNDFILNEYIREFIGEGQIFFYFKRLQKENIPSPIRPGIDLFPMEKNYYAFPLPESETSQRN